MLRTTHRARTSSDSGKDRLVAVAFEASSGAKTNVARTNTQPISIKMVPDDSLVSDFTVMNA